MLPSFLWDLTLEEAFETVIQQNEKLTMGNSMVPGTNKLKLLIDRCFSFSRKTEIMVKKGDPLKKKRGNRTSKIVKSRKSYSNGHLPYHCSFYYLARALVYDVACAFACAVRMRRNN